MTTAPGQMPCPRSASGPSDDDLPCDDDLRYAAAIASLPVAWRKLRQLLDGRLPTDVWDLLATGRHPADPAQALRQHIRVELVQEVADACTSSGVSVALLGGSGYPASLSSDPEAPGVLFTLGDATAADQLPRVAVVGTRSATAYGLGVASELGGALADAGVVVVSGLARGIDHAAHAGALRSPATTPLVGVLGSAPDAATGPTTAALRRAVAGRGYVVSEVAPGAAGARWNFAVRNRMMAAMAHVVVVVEAHRRSGAHYTVEAADQRNVAVGAVPGSIRSPASAGTNDMLADGVATPVRDVRDVLAAVGRAIEVDPAIRFPAVASPGTARRQRGRPPSRLAATVLKTLHFDPIPLEEVAVRSGLTVGAAALGLEQLAADAMAEEEQGWWSMPRG